MHAVLFCVGAVALHFALGHLTYLRSPLAALQDKAWQAHGLCGVAMLLIGVPLLLMGLRIARSGLVVRPGVAGLLIGVAAAVVADAVWRLHCPYTDPSHFFLSHSLPYVLLGLLALRRSRRAEA